MKWTKKDEERLKQLRSQGLSRYEICEKLGRTYRSVDNKIVALGGASRVPSSTFPVWDKPLETTGDAVILTDVEAPFQHSEFINRVLDVADAWGVTTLHLGGDLLHNDSLSKWGSEWTQEIEDISEIVFDVISNLKSKERNEIMTKLEERGLTNSGGYSAELAEARQIFKSFASFKEIVVCLGNHDDRYLHTLEQELNPKEILHQLDVHNDKRYKIAPYYYSLINTESGVFRVEHPRNAGRTAAIDLAVQYQQHVVMGHSHRWAVNRDPSGKLWAIQTGHCVDETRLAYVMQRSAKRDAHVLGATIIRDGYPFVLSPESRWDILKRM